MSALNAALLLVDLQNEMVDPKGKIGSGELAKIVEERGVVENAARALAAARAKSMKIVHVRLGFRLDYADALSVAARITKLKESRAAILGSWGTEFPEKLTPLANEIVFTKQCVNPFFNTGLLSWLCKNGIKEIAIGGVATNLAVESTARYADDAGLAVTVLEDCCASPNQDWHRFAVENMLPLFGRVITSSEFEKTL
jgi:nicotinamidase-related amidase